MWRFGLRQALRFVLGFLGAAVLAAIVAALPSRAGVGHQFLATFAARLWALARFDFGLSTMSALPAATELAQHFPATLELVGSGAVIALLVGAPLGILLGTRPAFRAAAPLMQIVAAAPVFCAGLGLLWLAVRVLHWHFDPFPAPGPWSAIMHGDRTKMILAFHAFALPVLTVGAAGAAAVQLALRRAASEAMEEPYRRGLQLMGLTAVEIDRLYLGPHLLTALLRNAGEIVLALFSAAAVAEWLFGWPGAAVLFLRSVALRDWNVAGVILFAFAATVFAADFLGALLARGLSGPEAP